MTSQLSAINPLTLSKNRNIINYRFLNEDTITLLHLMPRVAIAELPLVLGDH